MVRQVVICGETFTVRMMAEPRLFFRADGHCRECDYFVNVRDHQIDLPAASPHLRAAVNYARRLLLAGMASDRLEA